MDASTEELRTAHDALAELYAERLAHSYEEVPEERAVLGLFCDLVAPGGAVGDIGCGSGRLAPHLAAAGPLEPQPQGYLIARLD